MRQITDLFMMHLPFVIVDIYAVTDACVCNGQ